MYLFYRSIFSFLADLLSRSVACCGMQMSFDMIALICAFGTRVSTRV